MTQSEPIIPGTFAAITLIAVAFALLLSTVTAGLYGLYALSSWIAGLV